MITIVDYGLGNVGAFLNTYKRMNISARLAETEAQLADATHVVLPGVGAFDQAMGLLDRSGMRPMLEHKARVERVPLIGVCVGMQMLSNGSDEGKHPGLGLVPGTVRKLSTGNLPLPHMGWNDITSNDDADPLLEGLRSKSRFYFLHSFYFDCEDPADRLASVDYGTTFACAVRRGNIRGVQFHPEKSHHFGAALLKNFAAL